MPADKLRVGMIGAGSMAVHHLEAWSQVECGEVVSIANRTRRHADSLAQRFGIAQIYSSVQDLLHAADVDVVSIALPHHLHRPVSLAAIDAGTHVFCEKPLANSVRDAHEMWKHAVARGVKTGIQFGHRVLPGLRKLRARLKGGAVGCPEYLQCSWCFDWARSPSIPLLWRFRRDAAGAGALADLGVYAIDAARWLLGEYSSVVGHLETVVAHRPTLAGSQHFDQVVRMVQEGTLELSQEMGEVENEDECTFLAKFECGAHGFLRASRVRAEQRLLISGSQGELLWYLDGDRLLERREGQALFAEVEVGRAMSPTFVDQFLEDIVHGTDLGPSFYDGVKAQEVIDAVLASAVRGHWVSIPGTSDAEPAVMRAG